MVTQSGLSNYVNWAEEAYEAGGEQIAVMSLQHRV